MAKRRMISNDVVETDLFLEMPLSAQYLYVRLLLKADDDGFIDSPKKIMRMIRASDDDMKMLLAKRYLLPFESGVMVIKHWLIHNSIRKDRKQDTIHYYEMQQLETLPNESYEYREVLQPNDNQVSTKGPHRLGKVSIGKDRLVEVNSPAEAEQPIPYQEVIDYLNEKADRQFRNVESNKKHIRARFNEGYELEDFKQVIDNMVIEWGYDKKMAQYLRPTTLFGTKFDNYLNIKPKKEVDQYAERYKDMGPEAI